METEIGNPIEYTPEIEKNEEPVQEEVQEPYYMDYPMQQPMIQPPKTEGEKFDLFANVEKSTWIIAFAVFLLGFFMGKTMQPVILRYA